MFEALSRAKFLGFGGQHVTLNPIGQHAIGHVAARYNIINHAQQPSPTGWFGIIHDILSVASTALILAPQYTC